ncbi:MAG TPA: hypothetical protein VF798_15050 [Burkholderiaceae bacterium]
MNRKTIGQLRGAQELIEDAMLAGTDAAQRLQLSLTRQPYAVLEKIAPISLPVRAVEQVQTAMTLSIYGTIRSAMRATAALASSALDLAERT